jgi:hypothetical protein
MRRVGEHIVVRDSAEVHQDLTRRYSIGLAVFAAAAPEPFKAVSKSVLKKF